MRKLTIILFVILVFTLSVSALDQARGAVVMEPDAGRILYQSNADEPLGIASTTKIMTALITLEQPDIDTPFEVDAAAIRVEGSSMGLKEGDIVTLRTLAWGMLMHSGNDAANAAAVAIAGDTARFAELMNERANQIGMASTHFVNPSGLSEAEHYATARDMALLTAEALRNPDFREMCATKTVSVEYGNPPYKRFLLNHNRLLWRYEYAIGVKTGFTKAAGRCLVSAAEKEGVTLICVTLGCYDDFTTHEKAYETYFQSFGRVDFTPEVSGLTVPVVGGEAGGVALVTSGPLEASLMVGEQDGCRVIVEAPRFIYAPITAGEVVGRAAVYYEGIAVAECDLVAADTVAATPVEPSLWEHLFGNKETA